MVLEKLNKDFYYKAFCVALLPILLLRDFTPANELRYLSIADEALRNHTFFTFTNQGEPYADKPPLYFWWVMLGKWLFGSHQMWFLSLASLVPAIITAKAMDRWASPILDRTAASIAPMMLLTCGLFAGLAVTLRMDMLMCMFIVLALKSFYRIATSPDASKTTEWLFPVYVFLAVFSKGPVGLLVPLCATSVFLVWTGKIKQFGKYWGWRTWGVLAVGCAVWFGAVYIESGTTYLNNLLFHQTIDRAVNSFHHKEPFYYYGISVWYSIAPWSLLIAGLIVASIARKSLSSDIQRFYCAVIFTTFVLLSCISSKLQVYLLPAFPFMIYLAASCVSQFEKAAWLNVLFGITASAFTLTLPIIVILSFQKDTAYLANGWIYSAVIILAVSGALALRCRFRQRKSVSTGIRILAVGLTCTLFAGGWALPALNPWIGYRDLCGTALKIAKEKKAENIAVWGISRAENMDVYLNRHVAVIQEKDIKEIRSRHHTVLMLRKQDAKYFDGEEVWTVGPFAVTFLE